MAISPFSARPAPGADDRRRARMIVLIAVLGIAATLIAYAASPSVRHAVGHAAHSVNKAVSNVLDHDKQAKARTTTTTTAPSAKPRSSATHSKAQHTPSATAPAGAALWLSY